MLITFCFFIWYWLYEGIQFEKIHQVVPCVCSISVNKSVKTELGPGLGELCCFLTSAFHTEDTVTRAPDQSLGLQSHEESSAWGSKSFGIMQKKPGGDG